MAFPGTGNTLQPTDGASVLVQPKNSETTTVVICTPVYADASGTFKRALGDGSGRAKVIGLTLTDVASGAAGNVLSVANFTATPGQWDAVAGTTGGLVFGTTYYLDATTPGKLTTSSTSNVPVIKAISSTVATLLLSGTASGGGSSPIAPATIAGNNTGSSTTPIGLTDVQTKTLLNIGSLSVKDSAFGAKGDGTTDDTAAIQAAHNAAITAGKELHFPPGTYLITSRGAAFGLGGYGIEISSSHTRWVGHNAVISWNTAAIYNVTTAAIYVDSGLTDLAFDGLYFQGWTGAGADDKFANCGLAFFFADNVTDTAITNCTFEHCPPALYGSSDTSARALFQGNKVLNSPLAINLPTECKIVDNWFHNDVMVGTRSHAIYLFAHAQDVIITGNHFKNIAIQTVQIRAREAQYSQKGRVIIANNSFEYDGQNAIWGGADSESLPYQWAITGNTFYNSNSPIQLTGMQGAVVDSNVFIWDYNFAGVPGGTGVQLDTDSASYSPTRNVQVANNLFKNRHPFWASFHVTTPPANGDTITVTGAVGFGATTYTWRTTPSVAGEILISASVDDCADTLEQELRGNGSSKISAVLRDQSDAWSSRFSTAGMCWIASDRAFTISRTGTAVVCSSINDFSGSCTRAVNVLDAVEPVIRNNTINLGIYTGSAPIVVAQSASPVIASNAIGDAPIGIVSQWNAFPVIESNTFAQNMALHSTELSASAFVQSYDAFPVIRNNGQILNQTSTLPFMQGSSGYVPVGDGKARTYLFFGNSANTNVASMRLFSWFDGDRVQVYDGTHVYTFHFKQTSPAAGSEFNDYASLVALINGSTGGYFTASNPVASFFGSDPTGNGYIEIKLSTAGVAGAGASVDTSPFPYGYRMARTCGVNLKGWALGNTDTPFLGGAATATKTVVFTPLASTNVPLIVQGVDAASQALNPIAYQADTVPGVAYVITHSVAAGTEKFFWRVG